MAQGVDTSPETIAQFRAHYLYSGNASESARKVGLPASTGRDIAQRLAAEPEFVAARRALRDNALQELIAARMQVVHTALRRFKRKDPEPVITETGAAFPPDRRPEYGKLVLDAEKNAHNLAKIESDKDRPTDDRPLRIEIVAREDEDGDGNDPGVE